MSKQEIVIEDIVKTYENPISELVQVACQFTSTLILADDTHRVNAKSMLGIMAFEPFAGKKISIEANGEDEEAAIKAMTDFLLCRQ